MELTGAQSHLEDAQLKPNLAYGEASYEALAEPRYEEIGAAEGRTSSDDVMIKENPAYESAQSQQPCGEKPVCQSEDTYEPFDWMP